MSKLLDGADARIRPVFGGGRGSVLRANKRNAGGSSGTVRRASELPCEAVHKGPLLVQNTFIGTAGWSVERAIPGFSQVGTALERYSSVFSAVEINSSFYRRHRPSTWQRWHDAVPPHFRFSVKLPKAITHVRQLIGAEAEIAEFFADIKPLGAKLGAILVQLPPKLAFAPDAAAAFFSALQAFGNTPVFIEPRHPSWADMQASDLLHRYRVARVYADPQEATLRSAALSDGTSYLRLHGSPKIYYSAYDAETLDEFAAMLATSPGPNWCIFDNTASGAALRDALKLRDLLARGQA
ncbi:MAG: hypothetical protein JWR39_2296 [Devosia sp.]|nr:hypothetical protein [Devosia sp.]